MKGNLRFLLMAVALLSTTVNYITSYKFGASGYSPKTPSIPHTSHRKPTRTHAPNDGHWHMKFHRNR